MVAKTRRRFFWDYPQLRAGLPSVVTGYTPDFVTHPLPEIVRDNLFDALVTKAKECKTKELTSETITDHLFSRVILELNQEEGGRKAFFRDYIGFKHSKPRLPKEIVEKAIGILAELQGKVPGSGDIHAQIYENPMLRIKPAEIIFEKVDAIQMQEFRKLEERCRELSEEWNREIHCMTPMKGKTLDPFARQQFYAKQALVHVYEDAGPIGVILTLEAAKKACRGDRVLWENLFNAEEVDHERVAATFGQAINTANKTGNEKHMPNHQATLVRRNAFLGTAATGLFTVLATDRRFKVPMHRREAANINIQQKLVLTAFAVSVFLCGSDVDTYILELDKNMKDLLNYIGRQHIENPLKIRLPVAVDKAKEANDSARAI